MSASKAARFVAMTEELDLQHRRGWRPSEISVLNILDDMEKETRELRDAVVRDNCARAFPELGHPRAIEEAREEAADVFVCLLRLSERLGMSFQNLEIEALRKIRLRFEGAERLDV